MDELTHEQLLLLMGAIAALMTALVPILTSIGAGIGSWITARRAAKKDDVDLLRGELDRFRTRMDRLQVENDMLRRENTTMREYVARLRLILIEHEIDVPPMPDEEDAYQVR